MADQPRLIPENFETRKPAHPLYCHQDFLEKLQEHPAGKRAALLLQRLAVDPRKQHYKATMGANRGWRRSRLGGNNGSHFYAWWAPRGAPPLKNAPGFEEAPEGSIFLREIRHHDNHDELTPQNLADCYLPLSVEDLRKEEYSPSPWTPAQTKFAKQRSPVSILKGHPGSGKTTALWHAVDSAAAESVLYVTYSRDLAALAQDYFDRYCPAYRKFRVVTVPALMRELAGSDAEIEPESERRARFIRALGVNSKLGAWTNYRGNLYEEVHAHMIGEALPEKAGRFSKASGPRLSPEKYAERRQRFIGKYAAESAAETVQWMARSRPDFAKDLFPELHLAWTAAEKLRNGTDLKFDLLAIDEVQDLTPIEAYTLIQLAKAGNSSGSKSLTRAASMLIAGDEAQTVRPTDFEWAWLNDLLHSQIGAPVEHKLTQNLRSPRRIAELVNHVWELYSNLSKQDRPSGVGTAEIEEDAADQIVYCTATPGADLRELCEALAAREGLVMINMEPSAPGQVPGYIPESVRQNVLTAAEAKGLDFQSVAVFGAGKKLEQVNDDSRRWSKTDDIESLGRRLAIDELRVVLSRPTERLYWIDVDPDSRRVAQSLHFLNCGANEGQVAASVPSGVLRSLDEDQLDPEERIQRCEADARQYLGVKPGMAWTRAQQAVTLLGLRGTPGAVQDETVRRAAYMTMAEIAFTLAMRKASLPPELGKPDLLQECIRATVRADRLSLAAVIREIRTIEGAHGTDMLAPATAIVQQIVESREQMEQWFLLEVQSRAKGWLDELERAAGTGYNSRLLIKLLPPFYDLLNLSETDDRLKRLRQRSLAVLTKEKKWDEALRLLRDFPVRQPRDEAACLENIGDFHGAAEAYLEAGDRKDALQCFRKVPDFARTLALLEDVPDHPAAESLRWVRDIQQLAAKRPAEFAKVMTAPEKKLLEGIMEQSLGVTRRKPAATKKVGAVKKGAPVKKAAAKKRAPASTVRRRPEFF